MYPFAASDIANPAAVAMASIELRIHPVVAMRALSSAPVGSSAAVTASDGTSEVT